MTQPAIGQVVVGGRVRGTAFAVTGDLLLTCWHCVADPADATRLAERDVEVRFGPGASVKATFLQDARALDMALLGVLGKTPLPDGWAPLRLGRDADGPRGSPVDVEGWPIGNPSSTRPQVLPCRVEQEVAGIGQDDEVLQLYSDQVAARLRPRGFSGSPVLVRAPTGAVVIGVVRWMQEDETDTELAVGGVVYATRVSDIAAQWASLRPAPEPATALAGDTQAPSRLAIEDFVAAQLRGPGGALPFAGRTEELDRLSRWLDDLDAPGYHLVSGPAGIGKSTLVVRWAVNIAERQDVDVVVVPISVRYDTNGERDFLLALIHRLSRIHREAYDRNISTTDARETARALLSRPAPPGRIVVVMLDSLDEADGWMPGPRLFPRGPGDGVRLVVSVRHTADRPTGRAWADQLGLSDAIELTTLSPLGAETMHELLIQVRPHEDAASIDAAATRLWTLTFGEPVTVGLHLEDIRARPEQGLVEWAASRDDTPTGLDGFFDSWLTEQWRLWESESSTRVDDAERVLRVLVTAEGPISRTDLRTLVARLDERLDAVRLERALAILGRFILPGRSADTLVVAHPAIADTMRKRLQRDGAAEEYQRTFVSWGVEFLEQLRSGVLASAEVPEYLTRHLAVHLTAGSQFNAAALDLAAPFWRQVKDAVSDDLEGFRADVGLVMEQARRLDQRRTDQGAAPRLLPERILCAAEIAGERRALGGAMAPELAAELVRHRLWRPGRALAYVAEHTHPGLTDRVTGVVAVAAVVSEEDLPALDQLVESALKTTYRAEKAAAVAAWASRLLNLGHVSEALQAAFRLPAGHEQRSFVAVWVLAKLIPQLPDELASHALGLAMIELLRARPGEVAYAACELTKRVPLERAEKLWPFSEEATLPADIRHLARRARQLDDGCAPRAFLMAALDERQEYSIEYPFLRGRYPADAGAWAIDKDLFVAAGRWLTQKQRSNTIRRLFEGGDSDPAEPLDESPSGHETHAVRRYELEKALLPGINYDGLLSVLPVHEVKNALTWVRALLEGGARLCCLAQLLRLIQDERRRQIEDEIFSFSLEDFARLDGDLNLVLVAVPALVAGQATGRLLDVIAQSREFHWLPRILAPLLSESETRSALEHSGSSSFWKARNVLLARLASFGPQQAAAVLDKVSGSEDALRDELMQRVRTQLGGDWDSQPPSEQEHRISAWWRHAHAGSPPDGGVQYFRPRPRRLDDEELALRLADSDPEPSPSGVLALAIDLTASVVDHHVPQLIARARSLSDRWLGLTLLAAGTHVPRGPAAAAVGQAIQGMVEGLKSAAETSSAFYWFPPDSPWLVRDFSGWAPHVARVVHQDARAEISEVLFAGGYLDGVVIKRISDSPDLDRWAADALAVTPLLNASQLALFEEMAWGRQGRPRINSGTLRAYFVGGIAVGYAACGQLDDAYRVLGRVGGPYPDSLRRDVLADILYLIDADQLPGWVAQVQARFRAGYDREPLWAHLVPRLEELSDQQLWILLDQWLTEGPNIGRAEVLEDALMYRHAIARLAGGRECSRLMTLIERREAG